MKRNTVTLRDLGRAYALWRLLLLAWGLAHLMFWPALAFAVLAIALVIGGCTGGLPR